MKTFIKSAVVLFVTIFSFSIALAQDDYTTIHGIIKDSKTNEKLVFASVIVPGTSIGTVTNTDGEFTLKIKNSVQATELQCTHLGYKNTVISLASIKNNEVVIKLEASTVPITEVTVRPQDARDLINQAVENIEKNYCSEENVLTGFYRETVKQRKDYVLISEAIVDIYKTPYSINSQHDKVKVFKARKGTNVKKADTLFVKLQGGPHIALLLDVIKNPEVLFSKEAIEDYDFELADMIYINDQLNYVINFKQKPSVDYPLFLGKIYLNTKSLAVTSLEFGINLENKTLASQLFIKKKPFGMKIEPVSTNYLVNYTNNNGQYYFSYARSEVKFKVDWDKKLFKSNFTIMSEIAVTDRLTDNIVKFTNKETIKENDVFSEQANQFFDENYWGSYNTIEPDESIEAALKKFGKQMKKQ